MKKPSVFSKLDYKWVMVACCFLMTFVCLGFCSSNQSLYTFAITDALKISRSSYSLVSSIRYITTAVANIFFGSLILRFGIKKLVCAGFGCLILSMLTYSVASNIFIFYIGGCLLGLGLSWTSTTVVSSVINKWCTKNKGTIMGVVLAANGLGGTLASQIVSPIIYDDKDPFGFQTAYRLVAFILLAVAILTLLLFKEQPKNYNANTPDASQKKSSTRDWVGIEYSAAKRTHIYYIALICIFFTGFILQSITGVATVHMKDIGLDADYIATVFSIHSLALTAFKFLTGFIYDKKGLRFTMTVCSLAAIISMTALALVTNSVKGQILAMVYGVLSSLALPLETIMLPIYTGDLFGQKSYDKILGIVVSVNVAGYALGSPIVNIVFDIFGSYMPALIGCVILMVVVMITMEFVINSAKRLRKSIEAAEQNRTVEEKCI